MKIKVLFFLILTITLNSCTKDDFAWNLVSFPELGPAQIVSNTTDKITISSNCTNDGRDSNTERGICWGLSSDPTVNDSVVLDTDLGSGNFIIDISWNNSLDTTRHFRAFARNKAGITYSNNLAILNPILSNSLPSAATVSFSNVSTNSANISGEVLSNGGLPILEYGVCYSITNNLPTKADSYNSIEMDYLGDFDITASPLNNNATYYLRCFARNAIGTSYGAVITITTIQDYNIGDIGPSGGFIFYKKPIASNGWQFMEAKSVDLSTTQKWSYIPNEIGNNGMEIGSGLTNTNNIVTSISTSGEAAFNCYVLSAAGYDDWFLPSLAELNEMYNNLAAMGMGNFSIGGNYWSSSEDENFTDQAWQIVFNSGPAEQYTVNKTNSNLVRPVRRF